MTERDKPGVVLEIGVGGNIYPVNPTMLMSQDGRQLERTFSHGSIYIGVDCITEPDRYWDSIMSFMLEGWVRAPLSEEERQQFRKDFSSVQSFFKNTRPNENINFIVADAHDLPFRDGCIDEVFLSNVFDSQLEDRSIDRILENVSRVLRPGGRMVIRETATPQWSWQEMLPNTLGGYGFNVEEMVNYGSARYNQLLGIYGATFLI